MIPAEPDFTRYTRQIMLPEWGAAGQARLQAATVLVAGAGGLGSPAALYLAAAGVGRLRICDRDHVELTNLNRQILHPADRLGHAKAASAQQTLAAINPTIVVEAVEAALDEQNVDQIAAGVDLIVDCLDNYPTRRALNRHSVLRRIPLVHGAVSGMYGQLSFFHPPATGCLACLIPGDPPQSPQPEPAVGAVCGLVGSLQALEAIKFLLGMEATLKNRLLSVDGFDLAFETFELKRAPACPVCGAA